jgi:hypothetical protein
MLMSFTQLQVDMSAGADRPLLEVRQLVPWRRQYKVLLSRALKEQYRKTGVVLTQLAQAIVIPVLIGMVFLQVGRLRVVFGNRCQQLILQPTSINSMDFCLCTDRCK